MKMKKILLVSGCSMTDKNYVSGPNPEIDTSYPKWPEVLAKSLDLKCINLGQNGAGNEYIYSSLLEQILKTKDKSQIGLVIPAWSQCQRKDYQEWNKWKQKRVDPDGDVFGWLRKTLRYMISLQLVCERYNIPYKQFQMINLYGGWTNGLGKTDFEIFDNRNDPNYEFKYTYPGDRDRDIGRLQKLLLDYEPYINVENFIGWPTTEPLGGYDIESETIKKSAKEMAELWKNIPKNEEMNKDNVSQIIGRDFHKELILSEWDQHPNEKGHQKIAEFIYDRLG